MGGIKNSTYLDVKKALSRRFSPQDGWQYEWKPLYGNVQPDCLLSRRVAGRTERVVVSVDMAPKVGADAVKKLQEICRGLAAANISIDRAVLVVPAGAAVPEVPAGIEVLETDAWQVVSGRIIWSKNLERNAVLQQELAKSGTA